MIIKMWDNKKNAKQWGQKWGTHGSTVLQMSAHAANGKHPELIKCATQWELL